MAELLKRIVALILSLFSFLSSGGSKLPQRNLYPAESGYTRVMTFNLRYKYDYQRMVNAAELIGQYYPDSIGVQECTYEWMNILKKQLPEYAYVGVGRDTGNQEKDCGEQCGILYLKAKYELVDSGTFWLSETPDTVSKGWDGNCRRICTWVILKNKETGEKFAHFNTHLDHIGTEAREKGLKLVLDKVKEITDMPLILTGDFNFTEQSTKKMKLLKDSGLTYTKDAAAEKETGKGITYHDYEPESTSAPYIIDYIWVNKEVESVAKYKIIEDKIDDKFVSDHYPVMADIKM